MMLTRLNAFLSLLMVGLLATPPFSASAQSRTGESRYALIIGNDGYEAQIPTAANDAGLIADTLRAAEFDVSGARNLDRDTLRASIREFVDKVTKSGSDVVTFLYFAGYAVQYDGENYLVPVNATIDRAEDIPDQAVALSEITAPLAELPGKVRIVVLDAAHESPYPKDGKRLAGGLAAVEPQERGFLAFNAAPGTVAPVEDGSYGTYASALAEMIRTGGLSLDDVFERVRLKVSDATRGAVVPWNASKVAEPFFFLGLGRDAPRTAEPQTVGHDKGPIRSFPVKQAYSAALARDTLPAYQEYLDAFPQAPEAARVRVILAARREALTWQRARAIGTPQAYWSYLRRYPRGPHGWDARRRLARLNATAEPPGEFGVVAFEGVPPPPPVEPTYIDDRRYVAFGDYDLPPPPPPPIVFLPPPPPWWELPPPPAPAFAPYFLPAPRPFVPPSYVDVPRGVYRPAPAPVYVQEGEGDRRGRRFAEAVVAGTVAGAAAAVLFRLPAIIQRRIEKRDRIIQVATPAAEPRRGERRGQGHEREGRVRRLLPGQALPGTRSVAQVQAPTQGPGAIPRPGGRPESRRPAAARPAGVPKNTDPDVPPTRPSERAAPRVGAPLPSGRDLPQRTEPGERSLRPPPPDRTSPRGPNAPDAREPASRPDTAKPSPRREIPAAERTPADRSPAGRSPVGPTGPRTLEDTHRGPHDERLPKGERHREPRTGRPNNESGTVPSREPGTEPASREPRPAPLVGEPREPRTAPPTRGPHAAPATREPREPRPAPLVREPNEPRAAPRAHEPRPAPHGREPREPRAVPQVREPREPRAVPQIREPRDPQAAPHARELREPRVAPPVREPHEPRATAPTREPREPRVAPPPHEPRAVPPPREPRAAPHEPRAASPPREPPHRKETPEPRAAGHGREGRHPD